MRRQRSLSLHAQNVLAMLLEAGSSWSYGYELARATNIRSGTLYPLLLRLAEQGYLEAEWQPPVEAGRPPRHAYRLAAAGAKLAENVASTRRPSAMFAPEGAPR
jgi:DNA-binding PadR family transcriptional regulator